ncbi:hypothetical protein F5148DRAFT_57267 [Russula earlei]|uniref:Uncharacterized protein n=1 Tax=Russula earlei TaxID=71964 RepID=A0ACC0UKW5_9AGAM|nr:hypothetical protein F5148DRAFT_57267 [Russula earlei]
MPFFPRNRYYLRVSSTSILPLYVYLDSQHVDWMSDRVLREVVADLRPKIIPKLRAESGAYVGPGPVPANMKKGTVDVHRGDTYQFAYFLRETDPHSVLIKTRNFVLDTDPPLPTSGGSAERQPGKRDAVCAKGSRPTTSPSRKKRRQARGGKAAAGNGEEESYHSSDSEHFYSDELRADDDGDVEMAEGLDTSATKGTRRAAETTSRVDVVKVEGDEENFSQTRRAFSTTTESSHVEGTSTSITIPIEVDDYEPKPKLTLELKYRTFSNFNRCLCVVVEPWPPRRSDSRAPSLVPSVASRSSSVAPTTSEGSTSRGQRAKTPLFLPDVDVDDELTSPSHSRFRTLPPVPLFDDPPVSRDAECIEEWGDNAALMQFSQMLNATGRAGGADVEEEDEFDGATLFADAEEAKEL